MSSHSFHCCTKCGFILAAVEMPPVTLRSDMPILWEYAQHVEAYVADRLERRSGYLVGRIVFTHQLSEAIDLREARRGVRLVSRRNSGLLK